MAYCSKIESLNDLLLHLSSYEKNGLEFCNWKCENENCVDLSPICFLSFGFMPFEEEEHKDNIYLVY